MVIALLTVFGVEFEVVLRRKATRHPSLPPPATVIETTGEAVEEDSGLHARPLAKAQPRLALVRTGSAA